jgi:hypothetical protein
MAIAEPMAPIEPTIDNQKQMDADVMEVVKNKGKPKQKDAVAQAKNNLRRIIKQVGIDPQRIVQGGKYSEMALKNPAMYQMAIQYAIKENLISEKDVQKGGIDYKLLANGITAGRLAQELINEGAV